MIAVQQTFAELDISWALDHMLGLDDPARNPNLEAGKAVTPHAEREATIRARWRAECEDIIAYCTRRLREQITDAERSNYLSAMCYWQKRLAEVVEEQNNVGS